MKKKSVRLFTIMLLLSNITLSPLSVLGEEKESNEEGSTQENVGTKSTDILPKKNVDSSQDITKESQKEEGSTEIQKSSEKDITVSSSDTTVASSSIQEQSDTEKEEKKSKDGETAKNNDRKKRDAAVKVKTNGITVGVNVPTSFQTYTDPITKTKPEELTVSLPVSISQANLEGITIELPYGFIPEKSDPVFKNFSMTAPIFSLVAPSTPGADSIVQSYEEKKAENKLIIHLKKTTTTVETLNLRFKFNSDYDAKIPANQIIWNNLKAMVKDSAGNPLSESGTKNVTSNAVDGMDVTSEYFTPSTPNYVSGNIVNRLTYFNQFNKVSLLDGSAENKLFVEVPTGSTLSNLPTDYFEPKGWTKKDDPQIPEGYTRYFRKITDDKKTFTVWNYEENVNINWLMMDMHCLPPSSIKLNESFHIGLGMIYTKINGAQQSVYKQSDYTKISQPDWELTFGTGAHSPAGYQYSIVNSSISDSVAGEAMYVLGYVQYGHVWTTKNTGSRDIKNVDFVLYQKGTGSEKLNFDRIQVWDTTESLNTVASYYKIKYEIKNALTQSIREESEVPRRGSFQAILPSLNKNEYIDKVHVIPMGADGKSEGNFLPKDGFGLSYNAKNWANAQWPDGSAIPTDRTVKVPMGGTVYYDDETNNMPPTPAVKEQETGVVYYTPGQTTQARAQFVSSDAQDRKPGEIVDYAIQGYNGNNAVGDWTNPEVVVAIPKVLELQDPPAYKDFIDVKNNKTSTKSVKVTLVSSDDTYNYYKFSASSVGYQNGPSVSFNIPVKLKIQAGAPVGTYPIQAVTAGNNDPSFVQLTQNTNNLSDELAKKMGYDNGRANSYSGFTSGNTPLNVVYATKLNGETAGRKDATEAWSDVTNFSVDKGGAPQMKASVQNLGNTNFDNVRLYDILPSVNDGRGSTGNITFNGIQPVNGATVYYTTKPITDLPAYDSDLQDWDATKLVSYGFTTMQPSNLADATAVFIDFGPTTVAPNSNLDTILNFSIPNSDNQKAVNQFQYSAKELGSGTKLNAKSDSIVFSTEVAQVNFDQNLPSYLPDGISNATNIPKSQSELLDVQGNGSIKISSDIPTLAGYEFEKWVDKDDIKQSYQPSDVISFTKNSSNTTINLKAIWQATKVSVRFNENFGKPAKEVKRDYHFGDTIKLSDIEKPKRPGYEFIGWGSSNVSDKANFKDGVRINFTSDKTVYAVWKPAHYTVTFDANGGVGAMSDLPMIYDEEQSLPKNKFKRDGYIFKGWSSTDNGKVEWTDQESVKNLQNLNSAILVLYAVWEKNRTAVNVHDSTIYVGEKWEAKDNFDSALDKDGNSVDFKDITTTGTVDSGKTGSYPVNYNYDGVEATAIITVKAKQTAVNVHDSTIYIGEKWEAKDNFDSALDENGNSVDFKDITTTGTVNTERAGSYPVKYNYDGVEETATITVKSKQTAVNVHDSTIYVGDKWRAKDNFDSALDKDGNSVDFKDITTTGTVETDKIGSYPVNYNYDDVETTAIVTVKAKRTAVNVHDSTIYVGDKWKAKDNFDSTLDKDGNPVDFKNITTTGTVDTDKSGSYLVKYSYDGVKATARITVKAKQTAVNVHNSMIYVGEKWEPKDNFDGALNKDGKPVDFKDITTTGIVDIDKIGSYPVKYSYDGVEAAAIIRVKAKQTEINVHDSTIYVGDKWRAEDNFDSALNKDGKPVEFKNITTNGNVDTDRAGSYPVKYSYNGVEATANIIVKTQQGKHTKDPKNNSKNEEFKQNKKFPNTGEEKATIITTTLGFIMIGGFFIMYVNKRNRKK